MTGKTNAIRLCRFGGLSPVKQVHYDVSHPSFHSPPARKGLFAFPEHYVEDFLLSCSPRHPSGKSQWIKDEQGQRIKVLRESVTTCDEGIYGFTAEFQSFLKSRKLKQKEVLLIEAMECPYENDETLGMDVEDYCDNGCPIAEQCEHESYYAYLAYLKKPRIFEHRGELWHHFGEHCLAKHRLKSAGTWVKTTHAAYEETFQRMQHERHRIVHTNLEWTDDLKARLPNVTKGEGAFYHIGALDHFEVFIERLS